MTDVPLREYLELRIDAETRLLTQRCAGIERTMLATNGATDEHFRSVNEFRAALSDQTANMLTRAEYNAHHDGLTEKLDALTGRMTAAEGRATGTQNAWLYLVGFATLAATVVGFAALLLDHWSK